MSDFLLNAPPGDGISCLTFSPVSSGNLLVSSWDSTLRLYDTNTNMPRTTHYFNGAVLACCFDGSGDHAFAGGLDTAVHYLDLSRGTKTRISSSEQAISSLAFNSNINSIVSGSWDKHIALLDIRQPNNSHRIAIPGKVCSLTTHGNRIVVATVGRAIEVYDVRNLSQPEQSRESPLKLQTRKVACSLDGHGFAVGSVEGRLAIEYFDSSPGVQSKKYAFKCHRKGEIIYPVNAICYHPTFLTSFASGGCDGTVNIWDGSLKKKLWQSSYPTSISSLAFSHDGNFLAIAASYTFEQGEKKEPVDDNVYIHAISDAEVRPKSKV